MRATEPLSGRPGRRGLSEHLSAPLFQNAYLLMLSSAAQSLLGMVFIALATRLYSAHWVGADTTVIAVTSLLTSIGQLGLSSVIVRYLPAAHAASRRLVLVCYAGSLGVALVASGIALATVSLWSPPLAFLAHNGWWLLMFVLLSVTGTVFQLEDAVLVGLRRTRWVPVENVAFAVSRVAFIAVFVHILPDSGIVLATAIPSVLLPLVVNAAIFLRFMPEHEARSGGRQPQFALADVRRLVAGNYAGSLAEFGSLYLLPVVVTDRLGPAHEAVFYIPWQMMTGLTVLAANMSASLSVETSGGEELRRHARSSLRLVLAIMVGATVVVGLGAHWVLLIFGRRYAAGGEWALRWMLLATIPTSVSMIALAIARVNHDGRLIASAQITGAAALVGFTFLLLPGYGVVGTGLAALLSATLALGILAPLLWQTLRADVPEPTG